MHIVLDVVDLLQLHEIWSLRPIVTAFSRLERRETPPTSKMQRGNTLIRKRSRTRAARH